MQLRHLFLRHLAQTSPAPMMLEIERAEGLYFYTVDGKKLMDLISGIAVSALGHSHPTVVAAVKKQVDLYMHTMVYGDFVLSPQVRLAQALQARLPEPLESVFFVNSGAEAIEGAVKLAKKWSGRHDLVVCRNAYHGSSQGAASLMSDSRFTQPFLPLMPGIRFIDFNRKDALELIDSGTAAVVMETVQAEIGLNVPEEGYLAAVRKRCDDVGALLILDEIQAGYGRTGTFFAFEQHQITPDILCLAKAMGGGLPLGAFISSKEIMATLADLPALSHITTFGGHPVSCAAGLAALEVLENEELIDSVEAKATVFLDRLRHPLIKELRHCGLWFALDFNDADLMKQVVHRGVEKGIFVDWFLFNNESIRLCPPLVITVEQIHQACDIIISVLDDLSR